MLSEKQFAIVSALRKDARTPLALISRETGIPSSTVFDYYQQLQGSIILKHTPLLDYEKLGYPLRKKFLLRTKNRKELLAWLAEQPAVNNLSRSDSYDAVVEALFRNVAELERFKEELQHLQPYLSREIDLLETLREKEFMPSLPTA